MMILTARTRLRGARCAALAISLCVGSADAQTRTASDPIADAQLLFDQREPASTAASTLRRTHGRTIDQTATILRTVGYAAPAIMGAIRTEFNATLTGTYLALETSGLQRASIADAFARNNITLDCIDPQGYPRPCGNFGGGMDQPVMGQLSWSPQQNGYTDSLLTLTGTNIPALTVRIGTITLAQVSWNTSQVVVRLPSQPTQGPLTLRRTSDNVEGKLMTGYHVIAAPLPWLTFGPAAITGAYEDMKRWLSGAKIVAERCHVNGALAAGGIGVFSTDTEFQGRIKSRLNSAGAPTAIADAWGEAFRVAWRSWADGVTIPSLVWFPTFVTYSGAAAPLTPATPTPLAAMISGGLAQMLSPNLQARIVMALQQVAGDEPGRAEAVKVFSDAVSAKFAIALTQNVANVQGKGPVPTYDPPKVTVGAVANGTCAGVNVFPSALAIF
jgi:hypothetical protein